MAHPATQPSKRPSEVAKSLFLKLPSQLPYLVFPPTPNSPDYENKHDEDYAWTTDETPVPHTEQGAGIDKEIEPPSPVHRPRDAPPLCPPTPESYCSPRSEEGDDARPGEELSFAAIQRLGHGLHPWLMSRYDIVEELGAGGYGVVIRAITKCQRQHVAIKILWKSKMGPEQWVAVRGWDPKLLTTTILVPREAFVLRQIAHPGVIGYVDMVEDETFVYLVMEYFGSVWNPTTQHAMVYECHLQARHESVSSRPQLCPGKPQAQPRVLKVGTAPRPLALRRASTDLFECLEEVDYLPEETCKYIFKQIASTILHLHRKGIVHCDLKDENIVIDASYRVKLIDFGSAQMLDPAKPAPYNEKFRGTINFAPPEVLKGQVFQTPQAEIWAMGCILSVLLTGKGPFASAEAACRGHISEPIIPLPALPFDLMAGCLRVDPVERFNICQVNDHPWLA